MSYGPNLVELPLRRMPPKIICFPPRFVSYYPVNLEHHPVHRDLRNTHAFLRSHHQAPPTPIGRGRTVGDAKPKESHCVMLCLGCVNCSINNEAS